ncbi:duboraya [Platichthys flesus]|uniref:duboraya n=1 Tax=Platichthys flesus TaxID=8260 RepID=UPI002DBCC378|nr:duboraya [Platichthys flesus]XP_062261379.1 duboraya [Platichthys flesus]
MEEEAASQRSVAELAGRFRDSAPPHGGAVNDPEKPVRRRPPRSLQLPKTHGDDQEPSGVTSPLSAKTKRNSALIEKLQASLALSPSAQLTSPKSPAFRLLSPAFPPPSPGSAPVTTLTTSSTAPPTRASPGTEEEGPVSFEAPPMVEEGSILPSINKGRARLSLRRRPPSRRHRASSSGDEVGVTDDVAEKATAGGEEVFKTDDKTDASTCPEKKQSDKDDESKTREEDEEEEKERVNGRMGEDERDRPSSGREEEEAEQM